MNVHLQYLPIFLLTCLIFFGCKKEVYIKPGENQEIMPKDMMITIPQVLVAYNQQPKSCDSILPITSSDVYQYTAIFFQTLKQTIAQADKIISDLEVYKIKRAISISYLSKEDNRFKSLVVTEQQKFENQEWEYLLTITDVQSNDIGCKMYWNVSPQQGILLINPLKINALDNNPLSLNGAVYRIAFSASSTFPFVNNYTRLLEITINNSFNNDTSMYQLNFARITVGEINGYIDCFGNSNLPNLSILNNQQGICFSFIGSCKKEEEIAVSEIGLPLSNFLPINGGGSLKSQLLDSNSVRRVFSKNLQSWITDNNATVSSSDSLCMLNLCQAPRHYDINGLVSLENLSTENTSNYSELIKRLQNLTPYSPANVINANIIISP